MSRRTGGGLARLVVHNRGRKGVKDAVLAEECGVSAKEMYRRLGQKLLYIPRSGWFEQEQEKRNRDQDSTLPILVFTLTGVIAITAWLDTPQSHKAGLTLAPLLSTRRRASKNKQRRPPRVDDAARQAKYESALTRLQAARSNGRQRARTKLEAAVRRLNIRLEADLKIGLQFRSRRGVSARTGRVPSGSPGRSRTRKSPGP